MMPKDVPTTTRIDHFGGHRVGFLRFRSVLETCDLLMIFDWPKVGPLNQTNLINIFAETTKVKRGKPSRGQGGGKGEVNLPPGAEG